MRGNVDTRLRKLADGEADALVLALAGLERLGRGDAVGGTLDRLVPAAGQGALALQARPDALSAGPAQCLSTIPPRWRVWPRSVRLSMRSGPAARRRSERIAGCWTTGVPR